MKCIKNILLITLIAALGFISGCGNNSNNEKSIGDKQLDKLNFLWRSSSVTLDGIAKDAYDNFTITFAGTQGNKTFNFTTSGRPNLSPWPAAGTFTFDETDPLTKLFRDNDLIVAYEAGETTLTMKFHYDIAGFTGRKSSVKGEWEFNFTKQ